MHLGKGMTTRAELAKMIDHTLLTPEATAADVAVLCAEGRGLGVAAVCVPASLVTVAARELRGSRMGLAAVVGFPSGAHHRAVKVLEAAIAVSEGADELDMVIDLGLARAGCWDEVGADIQAVRDASPAPVIFKVILETALLTAVETITACRVAELAGADYVKTSTGFHPSGGASLEAVRLMAKTVGSRLGVKASGGIRTTQQALAMVDAGATRLGLSRTASVLAGLDE